MKKKHDKTSGKPSPGLRAIFITALCFAVASIIFLVVQSGPQPHNAKIATSVHESAVVIHKPPDIAPETEKPPMESDDTPEIVAVTALFNSKGFIFDESDIRLLTENEIRALEGNDIMDYKSALVFARAEIFARHGNGFDNKALMDHYNAYQWYRDMEKQDISSDSLNDIEKQNAELIESIIQSLA